MFSPGEIGAKHCERSELPSLAFTHSLMVCEATMKNRFTLTDTLQLPDRVGVTNMILRCFDAGVLRVPYSATENSKFSTPDCG